jgi:SAM-dependent methyltransferase/putative flippase GtrA
LRSWLPASVFVRFFVLGLVVVGWGFGLNIFLNEWLHFYRPAAYALVVASQMLLGFLLNRYGVFRGTRAPFMGQFLKYLSALALFRFIDWILYTAQVELFAVPYLLAQGANTVFIFLSKFLLYRRIFTGAEDMTPQEVHEPAQEAGAAFQEKGEPNLRYHEAQANMALLPNYYRWVGSLFRRDISGVVLELGCGAGHMLSQYQDLAERIVAVDVNPICLGTLRETYGHVNVEAIQADLSGDWGELKSLRADVVVALDLLEHVENEAAFLSKVRSHLKPGGRVALKVPAQRRLFSEADRASGHWRRYDEADLVGLMESAGFRARWVREINPAGALAYRFKRHRSSNFSGTFSREQLRVMNACMVLLPLLDWLPLMGGLSLAGVFSLNGDD